jgi:ABC-type amino acid transport system permease subunit
MDAVIASLPEYWDGFLRTLYLSVISGIIALIVGTLLAAMRVPPWLRSAASACFMLKLHETPH